MIFNKSPNIKRDCEIINYNYFFPLIGICVSYNYMDTLKFMLPINYRHFSKIYIVTQKTDISTINFSRKFDNIKVIFYELVNSNRKFDKWGAIKFAQKIIYKQYPLHWYLIFDSDVILPANFIKILENSNLKNDYLYSGVRTNIPKSSEILSLHSKNYDNEPMNQMFLGSFQLYKQPLYQPIFHRSDTRRGTAEDGDIYFNRLFKNKQILTNLVYLHLGPRTGTVKNNWRGKKYFFKDDININLRQFIFSC